jgi:Uma2 family endonuclease
MEAVSGQQRRWSRSDYEKMITAGIFRPDERIELLEGEIVAMTPQHSRHATAVRKATRALERIFAVGYDVRPQLPLNVGSESVPEPDVAVVTGDPDDYAHAHPTTAILILEVSESTLRHDRQRKGAIYAAAGIAEYWIINLDDRRLEVYRDPAKRTDGAEYRLIQRLGPGDRITPLSATVDVAVDDLLPAL